MPKPDVFLILVACHFLLKSAGKRICWIPAHSQNLGYFAPWNLTKRALFSMHGLSIFSKNALRYCGKNLHKSLVFSAIFALRFLYRVGVRPWLHGGCRFDPTCSTYGIQALQQHSPIRAIALILWRIARCHPWGQCGHDPVPPPLFPSS